MNMCVTKHFLYKICNGGKMTTDLTVDESLSFTFSEYFNKDSPSIAKRTQYKHNYFTRSATKNSSNFSKLLHEGKLDNHLLDDKKVIDALMTPVSQEERVSFVRMPNNMTARRAIRCCDKHIFECRRVDNEPKNLKWDLFVKISLISLFAIGMIGVYYQMRMMTARVEELSNELLHISSHFEDLSNGLNKATSSQDSLMLEIQDISQELPKITKKMSFPLSVCTMSQTSASLEEKDVKQIMENELKKYDADRTSKVDFALESAGGKILSIRKTKPYFLKTKSMVPQMWKHLTNAVCPPTHSAKSMLQPHVMPGQCFAFHGAEGEIVIRLLGKVHVSGLTLEHIPAAISPTQEISSAPKEFSFWGLKDKNEEKGFFFGEFTYDKDGPPRQYFNVQQKTSLSFKVVDLRIHSNWGNSDYTCIYRLRVHGKLDKREANRKKIK